MRKWLLALLPLIGFGFSAVAEGEGFVPTMTVAARPVYFYPVEYLSFNFTDNILPAIGGDVLLEYRPKFWRNLHFGAAIAYDTRNLDLVESASTVRFWRLAGRFDLGLSFGNLAGIYGGPYIGAGASSATMYIGESYTGNGSLLVFGGRLFVPVTGRMKLVSQVEASVDNNVYISDIAASVGLSLDILRTIPGGPIQMDRIQIDPLFPSLYSIYDSNTVGVIEITNRHDFSAENVSVSLHIPNATTTPYVCATGLRIGSRKSAAVDLFAPISRETLANAGEVESICTITVVSEVRGTEYTQQFQCPVTLLAPNAIDWFHDLRLGAFITPRDETVLILSREIVRSLPLFPSESIDPSVRRTIATIEYLAHYEYAYAQDPNTPYSEIQMDSSVLDTVFFPRQTANLRSGDCDDLTVLFCALLESMGTETAYITVPGHILPAIRLPDSSESGKMIPAEFSISVDGANWLPIEITLLRSGYEKTFDAGYKMWRDNADQGNAVLWPTHRSWEEIGPVSLLPTSDLPTPMPDRLLENRLAFALERFVRSQIQSEVQELSSRISKEQSAPHLVNRLGVLYARNGLHKDAAAIFAELVQSDNYYPAVLNLGGILFLQGRYTEALLWLQKAVAQRPDAAKARLALTQTYYALGQYADAAQQHAVLSDIDTKMAESVSYAAAPSRDLNRAAKSSTQVFLWED